MEAIRVERSAGLVTITLDRPAKKNALDSQTWIELDRALADEARCQHITYASEDVREGSTAYVERREPQLRGC